MLLAGLAAVALLFSAVMLWEAAASRLHVRRLDEQPACAPGQLPRVSVIVPAHNEERELESAVRSLVNQDYPDLEIILVDDRSSDGTGAIMDGLARQDPRIRVLHIKDLPQGWMGKQHALWRGWQVATGAWLLFTDADVHMEPTALRRAMGYALRRRLDHLTVAPFLAAPGLLLSAWIGLFTLMYVVVVRPHRSRRPGAAGAVGIGAFNLIRRQVYEAIGTHRAIALRPDDDLQLGQRVKAAGYRQDILVAGDLVRVAWYPTVAEAIRGLERSALAGVEYRWPGAVASLVGVALLTLGPWAGLLLAGEVRTRLLSAAAVLLQAAGYLCANPPSHWRSVMLYPVAAALFACGLARAYLLAALRGGLVWGDRFFPLSALRQPGAPGPGHDVPSSRPTHSREVQAPAPEPMSGSCTRDDPAGPGRAAGGLDGTGRGPSAGSRSPGRTPGAAWRSGWPYGAVSPSDGSRNRLRGDSSSGTSTGVPPTSRSRPRG